MYLLYIPKCDKKSRLLTKKKNRQRNENIERKIFFHHVFTDNFNFFLTWFGLVFGAIPGSGSRSNQIIRIRIRNTG